jgi:hypothetical protein
MVPLARQVKARQTEVLPEFGPTGVLVDRRGPVRSETVMVRLGVSFMKNFPDRASGRMPARPAVRSVIAALALAVSLCSIPASAQAQRPANPTQPEGSFSMEGVADWVVKKFTQAELESSRPGDFGIESQMCSCTDRPEPHYPYILVFFNTPKGDLVGRPDRKGFETVIARLAVRHGEEYCDVDSEDECYGSFSHPCDFSDFRYGSQLAPYFPTCKLAEPDAAPDPDSGLSPVRHGVLQRR